MASQDENMMIIIDFLEKGECRLLIIYASPQGQLIPITTYPATTKAKVCIRTYVLTWVHGDREKKGGGAGKRGGGGTLCAQSIVS